MSSGASVTHWIHEFQRGNPLAAQTLWERYFQRLVRLARQELPGRALRVADEEDVALSAFHSFCRGDEADWKLVDALLGERETLGTEARRTASGAERTLFDGCTDTSGIETRSAGGSLMEWDVVQ